MAVKIRLSRIGTKNAPVYRLVAMDAQSKRDGQALEILGTYNPVSHSFVQFHEERLVAWIGKGAMMTDAAKKLHKEYKKLQKSVTA